MTIDTTSNKLVILSNTISGCPYTFQANTSTSFTKSSIKDSVVYLEDSMVEGYKVSDSVSLVNSSFEVPNFNFLLGNTASGFACNGGLLGLSRTFDSSYSLYYEELYKLGKTPSSVFALYMANDSSSTFQIGGFNSSYIKT